MKIFLALFVILILAFNQVAASTFISTQMYKEIVFIRVKGRVVGNCKSNNVIMWLSGCKPDEGIKIPIKNGQFEIDEATSGGQYFMTLEEELKKHLFPIIALNPHVTGHYYLINCDDVASSIALSNDQNYSTQIAEDTKYYFGQESNKFPRGTDSQSNAIVVRYYDKFFGQIDTPPNNRGIVSELKKK